MDGARQSMAQYVDPLDSAYPFPMLLGSLTVPTLEHALQIEKVRCILGQDRGGRLIDAILGEQDASNLRALTGTLTSHRWTKMEGSVMLKLQREKFNVCPSFRIRLLGTCKMPGFSGASDSGKHAVILERAMLDLCKPPSRGSVLVLADSHGRHLHRLLNRVIPGVCVKCPDRGGSIHTIQKMLLQENLRCYSAVVLHTGATNLIQKGGKLKQDKEIVVRNLLDLLQIARIRMHPSSRLFYSTLLPMEAADPRRRKYSDSYNLRVRYVNMVLGNDAGDFTLIRHDGLWEKRHKCPKSGCLEARGRRLSQKGLRVFSSDISSAVLREINGI